MLSLALVRGGIQADLSPCGMPQAAQIQGVMISRESTCILVTTALQQTMMRWYFKHIKHIVFQDFFWHSITFDLSRAAQGLDQEANKCQRIKHAKKDRKCWKQIDFLSHSYILAILFPALNSQMTSLVLIPMFSYHHFLVTELWNNLLSMDVWRPINCSKRS